MSRNFAYILCVLIVTCAAVSEPSPQAVKNCVQISKCSMGTYRNLFGNHKPPINLSARFQDIYKSVLKNDELWTLEVWSYYVKNITVCAHLAPALTSSFHDHSNQMKDAGQSSPMIDNLGNNRDQTKMEHGRKSGSGGPPKRGGPGEAMVPSIFGGSGAHGPRQFLGKLPVDPTHPLSKDLKDAINAILSNHTKEILKKLNIKDASYTYSEITDELTFVDKCKKQYPTGAGKIAHSLQAASTSGGNNVVTSGWVMCLLSTLVAFFNSK